MSIARFHLHPFSAVDNASLWITSRGHTVCDAVDKNMILITHTMALVNPQMNHEWLLLFCTILAVPPLLCAPEIPTHIHTSEADPNMMPTMRVDKGAISFVMNGANIMCAGFTSKGGSIDTVLEAGSPVVSDSGTLQRHFP